MGAADKDTEFASYMAARQPSLLRTAHLLTGDTHTAEDLVQTAFAKLYLAWGRVQRSGSLDAYVRRILVNEHNSLWRKSWKRREYATDEVPDQAVAPATDQTDTNRALWEFVQTLPKKQRAAVVLRYYEELTEAETADALGVSVGTVKSQTSRALATLRSQIGSHPTLSDSGQADPTQADPTQADPTQADPTQADPTQADPTQADRDEEQA